MTNEEKQNIRQLQTQGYGYRSIAAMMGLPINTIKSYCRRHPIEQAAESVAEGFCRECGIKLIQMPHRKEKKFCSDKCRAKWWAAHTEVSDKRNYIKTVCVNCGNEFETYPSKQRKFCSRACFADSRRKEHSHEL